MDCSGLKELFLDFVKNSQTNWGKWQAGIFFVVGICIFAGEASIQKDNRLNFKCETSSTVSRQRCLNLYDSNENMLNANLNFCIGYLITPVVLWVLAASWITKSKRNILKSDSHSMHITTIYLIQLVLRCFLFIGGSVFFLLHYEILIVKSIYPCKLKDNGSYLNVSRYIDIGCSDEGSNSKTTLNFVYLVFSITFVIFGMCEVILLRKVFCSRRQDHLDERSPLIDNESNVSPNRMNHSTNKVNCLCQKFIREYLGTLDGSSNKLKRRYLERCHKMIVLEVRENRLPRKKELDMDNWCLSFRFVQERDADDAFSKITGEREHYMRNMLKFSKGRSTNFDDLVQHKVSFLRGIAGIGKTTMTRFLAWKWANEKIFQEFTHLILIDAKELSTDVDKFLDSELKDVNGTFDPNASVVIILDGLDEIKNLNEQITDTQSSLFKLLNMRTTVIDSFKLIVTGRPHIQSILTSHFKRAIKIFELCPLEDKDIEKYIQNFEKEDDKKAINATLKSSPSIDNVKRIPQYLNTLCCVAVFSGGLSVKSVTELYVWMFKIFYMAHVTRRTDLKTDQIFGDKDFKAFVKDIGKISYELIQENKLIFEEQDFKAIVQRMQKSDRKDFFNTFFSETNSAHTTEFKFVHFSLQEFFASLHVFCSNVECKELLERQEYNMIKYVCGLYGSLLSESKNLTKDFSTVCLDGKDKEFDIKFILNALHHPNLSKGERLSVALEFVIEFTSWNESSITDLLETIISVADDKTLDCRTWQSQYNFERMLKSLENQNSLSPLKEVFLNLPAVEHVDIVKWCKCFNSVFLNLDGVPYENQHKVSKLLNCKDGDIQFGRPVPLIDIEVAKKMKENGINLCCFTSLHEAAYKGDLEYLKEYFKKAASSDFLDWMDDYGQTPLHFAAEAGYVDTVRLLLDKGADVGLTNRDGQTPLHYAAREGHMPRHMDVARLLLDGGANINLTSQNGETPLDVAKRMLEYYPEISGLEEIVKLLEDKMRELEASV